jgi:hypothetical protein
MTLDIGGIHRCWQHHLGDRWASVNAMLRLSARYGKPAMLSRWTYVDLLTYGWIDLKPSLVEILTVLDAPGCTVHIVDEKPTVDLHAVDVWNRPYYKTHAQWSPENAELMHTIAYQWDGIWNGALKNPPQEHINLFHQRFPFAVQLGKQLDLFSIVTHLAHSLALFTIDSGMSHVARSVGTPMYLCKYQGDLDVTHRETVCTRCRDIPDALEKYALTEPC